jgi:hypothetical protein
LGVLFKVIEAALVYEMQHPTKIASLPGPGGMPPNLDHLGPAAPPGAGPDGSRVISRPSFTFEAIQKRAIESVYRAKRRAECTINKFLIEGGCDWMHGSSCPECGNGPTNELSDFLYDQIKKVMMIRCGQCVNAAGLNVGDDCPAWKQHGWEGNKISKIGSAKPNKCGYFKPIPSTKNDTDELS